MEPFTTKLVVTHGAIAVFGAIVHAAGAHRDGESKTFLDFLILTVMSSFSGVIFALLALYLFGQDTYLTLAIAGTGGFLGVEGMGIIVKKIQQLISSGVIK